MAIFLFAMVMAVMPPITPASSNSLRKAASSRPEATKDRRLAISMTRTISSLVGSLGRVYVADRLNSRIQVFDQDGNFVTAWHQIGQPSSVFVGPDDRLYVGAAFRDEATRRNATSRPQPGELHGIVVGSAINGSLLAFIPDPTDLSAVGAGSSASGIAADAMGNVYAADVGAHKVRKYILQR